MNEESSLITKIEQNIYIIRGQRVMLDRDLASLYQVETKKLLQAVKRNQLRFPDDFMFQLSKLELEDWRSQFVTSNSADKMGLRRQPYAFTEQGVAMLSGVLRSSRAVVVNIEIMRTFVRMRHVLTGQKELNRELAELRSFLLKYSHSTNCEFRKVWQAIEKLSNSPSGSERRIGFELS